ncbi:hypothetical protein CYMTET_18080 [Cymbomonas tetramitiformis]|uniref:Uncharacterized protein n=1 Tax=Cymbomonas tetramitiformis TaxID=36881 RepID=A0AAE0G8Y8_9CHLO|nr:hypothetical protein CYMTET_18080 [Cymbomonas tetramitiformis]
MTYSSTERSARTRCTCPLPHTTWFLIFLLLVLALVFALRHHRCTGRIVLLHRLGWELALCMWWDAGHRRKLGKSSRG